MRRFSKYLSKNAMAFFSDLVTYNHVMKSVSFLLSLFILFAFAFDASRLHHARDGLFARIMGEMWKFTLKQVKAICVIMKAIVQQLSQMRGTAGRRLGPLWIPTGLTLADSRYELKTATKIYDLGYGRYCAVLNQVHLFLGYRDIDVYISSKYARGTCEYHSILNHENTHVQPFFGTHL